MSKRVYGTGAKRRNITASDETWELLKKAGMGNASEGVRVLTELYIQNTVQKPQ